MPRKKTPPQTTRTIPAVVDYNGGSYTPLVMMESLGVYIAYHRNGGFPAQTVVIPIEPLESNADLGEQDPS